MPSRVTPDVRRRLVHAAATTSLALAAGCGGDATGTRQPPVPPPPAGTPRIGGDPGTLTFRTQAGTTPTTSSTQVALINAGTGALTGLSLGPTVYGSGAAGWLTASLAGTAAPTSVTVVADWAGLAAGTYTATIPVRSSVAGVAVLDVPVTLTVTAPPVIALRPDRVAFEGVVNGTNPPTQRVVVENAGGGTLADLAVGTVTYGDGQPRGWLLPRLGSTIAPASLALDAEISSLAPGTYTASVPLRSSGSSAANVGTPVSVSLTIDVPPSALVARPSNVVTFAAPQGASGADPQLVRLAQGNGSTVQLAGLSAGPIRYGAGASGWLARTTFGTITPDSLRLAVQGIATLAAGNYSASFDVTSTSAGVAPLPVTVNLVIGSGIPPRIVATTPNGRDTVTIQMARGGALPPVVDVQVTNGGTLPLTGLGFTIRDGANWLAPVLQPSGNGATLSIILNVNAQLLEAGSYTTTILIESSAPGVTNSPLRLPVVLRVN
ncbi:MAG: hypothetical protein MUF21_03610 [Gemmatimonadaceae bacterium]|nr:hypothetical protein [Gemmatimonadaceae bacterium]